MQLGAAVTAGGTENIAGQTFGMNPHHHRLFRIDLALDQGDMFLLVDIVLIGDQPELTGMEGRQPCFGSPTHQHVLTEPIGDQVGDGGDLQAMLFGEDFQIRHPGHRAVFLHDLANDAGGAQPGNPGQIDRSLGLPGTHQHAAPASPQGENVAGADNIPRCCLGMHRRLDGSGPICSGNACTDPGPRLNTDGKPGAKG